MSYSSTPAPVQSYVVVLLPQPPYGAAVMPHYHRYPRYPEYIPTTHYGLPAMPSQPSMRPNVLHQASTLPWQRRANISQRRNRNYASWLQRRRRANIPPWRYHPNINIEPAQHQANMTGLGGYWYGNHWYDNPTSISDTEEVQPQPADDAEVMTDNQLSEEIGTDIMTEYGGTPAAKHVIESLPSVVLASDAEPAECAICMDEMTQDRDVITKLPCGHLFHGDCVVSWLCNHNTCPLCRFKLP
jgi:Ring finger domain